MNSYADIQHSSALKSSSMGDILILRAMLESNNSCVSVFGLFEILLSSQ
jgi:hypothetical protein